MTDGIYRSIAQSYLDTTNNLQFGETMNNIFGNGSVTANLYNIMYNMMVNVSKLMSPIGLAITVLFFIISLVEFAMSDRLTIESFIKFFAKLVIGVFCIANCAEITTKIIEFSDALSEMVKNYTGDIGSDGAVTITVEELAAKLKEVNGDSLGEALCLWLSNLGTSLLLTGASIAIVIVLYIIGFSRLLELCIRGAFMPIALGLISDDGWKGTAGRYIKKFLAICCQSSVLLVIGVLLQSGMDGMLRNATNAMAGGTVHFSDYLMAVGLAIAGVAVMFKSIGIVNDIFGA